MKLLDPGSASHAISMSDSGLYFVDNSSRVNFAPVALLHDAHGGKILDLERKPILPPYLPPDTNFLKPTR
jgi:hypothetical protein